MKSVYKIKNAFRIPMTIAILLSIPVLIDVFNRQMETVHLVLVLTLMGLFYITGFNSLLRRTVVLDDRIIVFNIFGKKDISLDDISFIDGLTLGSRQFISISTKGKNVLIPNSFNEFHGMARDVASLVKQEKIGDGLRYIVEHPSKRASDTISAWITVLILSAILYIRIK